MPWSVPQVALVTRAQIADLIGRDRAGCQDVVRRAYLAHDGGLSVNPHSAFLRPLDQPCNRIIALPAYLGGEQELAGIKWIASYPDNTAHGLPRASAVMIVNEVATGFPTHIMEASVISATRTAASAVLAAQTLTGRRRSRRIGFVGTGLIADHVRAFLRDLGWRSGGFRLFDLDRDAADRFAASLTADGADDVRVVAELPDAMVGCDLVVVATVAGTPHIHDEALLEHAPVVLHLSLRDLAPALVLAAQNVTDDIDHVLRERTSLHLAEQQVGHRDFVSATLADALRGRWSPDPDRAVVFSPFGLGMLDLALAGWIRDALDAGTSAATTVDLFSADLPPGAVTRPVGLTRA